MNIVKFLKKVVIWEIIFLSGSVFFSLRLPVVFIPLFVLTSFYLFIKVKHGSCRFNLRLTIFLVLWILINHLLVNTDLKSNVPFTAILYIIGSYFAISSISYAFLRQYLLKYFSYLCFVSIIIYISSTFFQYPSPAIANDGKISYITSFVFFNVGWFGRLSSIYWEPGQFQIVDIFILCLYSDYLLEFRKHWRYLLFPIVALLCTISTGGYLSLVILLVGVTLSLNVFKKHKFLYPISFICAAGLCYAVYQSEAVQSKIEQKNSNIESSSFYIRLNDNLGLLKMASDNPIWGNGMETRTFDKLAQKNNNLTSSNGWLYAAASNGVLIPIIFLFFLYKGTKRNIRGIHWIFPFCALVFSQAIEYYIFFPIMFMYVFKFNNMTERKVITRKTSN